MFKRPHNPRPGSPQLNVAPTLTRRLFVFGSTGAAATVAVIGNGLGWSHAALAAKRRSRRVLRPRTVRFGRGFRPGTIVINPRRHPLYLVLPGGRARRYAVGVGKAGRAFRGRAVIGRKAKWPRWTPTRNMIRREPEKYAQYADGLPGGPGNPLGARALYLYRRGRDTLYRIHGTNNPASIGQSVSNGCIRMLNAHVKDLYRRVPRGAPVVVL